MQFVTVDKVVRVPLHVHSVLLCDVPNDPFGATVLLRGQQPTQGLREDPVEKMWKYLTELTKKKLT